MFEALKKLISKSKRSPKTSADTSKQKLRTKQCCSCGKTILYDPEQRQIPKYCADCYAKYRTERGMITRTCKICGKTFSLPENVQHWPDYCQECRAKYRPVENLTGKCRRCGKTFSFPSDARRWPKYCPECQAKKKWWQAWAR